MHRVWTIACGLVGLACSAGPTSEVARAPGEGDHSAPVVAPILLARHPEWVSAAELPTGSRPDGAQTPARTSLKGPLPAAEPSGSGELYVLNMPVRGIDWGFSRHQAPVGVRLLNSQGRPVPWKTGSKAQKTPPPTWDATDGELRVRVPVGTDPSELLDWTFVVPSLAKAEDQLQLAHSGRTPVDHALRTVLMAEGARHGVFLPAPAVVEWTLSADQLAGRRLQTRVHLLDPFVSTEPPSDGATLQVVRVHNGQRTVLHSVSVAPGTPTRLDVAIDAGALPSEGPVALRLETDGGASPHLDYVFCEEPALLVPDPTPTRVLLVVVDTLRADRLRTYGHHRPTSPTIDALAARGVRFDAAHAPAPWTLPSTRSILSGRRPDAWAPTDHLGHHLATAGFATALISGNTFVSRYVDMHRAWTRHTYALLAPARTQVARAREFLADYPQQDVALVLQLMDPHLPYEEPKGFRQKFTGPPPEGLYSRFGVTAVRKWTDAGELDDTDREWIRARYDQNILLADRAIAEVLEVMGPETLVVVVSDHGEEFWDHGGFEHGHSVYEELVRVPLVMAGPSVPQAVVAEPVSVMDVVPTIFALLGLPAPDVDGVDLGPAMHNEPGARSALLQRPLAFSDLLYGADAFGVLVDGHHKWISTQGTEQTFDLAADPSERSPAVPVSPARFHAALAEALGVPVLRGFRVAYPADLGPESRRRTARGAGRIVLEWPGGFLGAVGARDHADKTDVHWEVAEDRLMLTQARPKKWPSEIYVAPVDPDAAELDALGVERTDGAKTWRDSGALDAAGAGVLRTVGPDDRPIILTPAVFPFADAPAQALSLDPDAEAALEALGYLDE